ncbi:type VII secretion protein EsaA [Gemella sanguinis]|uniref:type VII secretion protein EsaA n=1 Tax=Gemella sanguinis TaxID=84135 RepID=UPI00352C5442
MSKRTFAILSSIIALVVMVVVFYGVMKPKTITVGNQEKKITNSDVKIALVNEDTGVIYNGDDLRIGDILVNSLGQETSYKLETVSRAIAENGLEKGNYNVMIVLPSNFSRETLSLESDSPTQAIFQYKVKSDSQAITKQGEQVVSEIKNLFNKNIIGIYFSSIIGNLQTAQTQVATSVGREKTVLNKYQSNLITPLTDHSTQFKGLSGISDNLVKTYESFNKDLQNTNEAYKSIMDTDKTYDDQISKATKSQEVRNEALKTREETLKKYEDFIKNSSVSEQLENIKKAQAFINANQMDPKVLEDTENKIKALEDSLDSTLKMFNAINAKSDAVVDKYKEKIDKAVEDSLNKTKSNEKQQQTVVAVVDELKKSMLDKVTDAVKDLPYYSNDAIDKLKIADEDKDYLKKVNSFAEQFANANKITLKRKDTTYSQNQLDILKKAAEENVKKVQTMSFSTKQGKIKKIELSVNPQYKLTNVSAKGANPKYKDGKAILEFSGNTSEVKVSYQLGYANGVELFTPAAVKGTATTTETIKEAKTKEEVVEEKDKNGKKVKKKKTSVSPENKEIEGTIGETAIISPVTFGSGNKNIENSNTALYNDLENYTQLATVVKTIYGIDIARESAINLNPKEDSLLKKAELKDINKILTSSVSGTIIDELKKEIVVSDSDIKKLEELQAELKELKKVVSDSRKTANDLSKNIDEVIKETEKINTVLSNKPELPTTETKDNSDLMTVTMEINNDYSKLMSASRELLAKTKASQATSESINHSFESLGTAAKKLEQDGTNLTNKVSELKGTMDKEYKDNQDFLKAFSKVLSNTKDGNSKNQAVYDYLANPVDAGNVDKIVASNKTAKSSTKLDTRTGILIVLIIYLVSILIAHMMQNIDFEKIQKSKIVSRVQWKNSTIPVSIILGISFILSMIIGMTVGYNLDLTGERALVLVALLLVITVLFIGLNNWLLSKGKSLGLFVSISILLLYIVTTVQLIDERTMGNKLLSYISPLNYIDESLTQFLNYQGGWLLVMIITTIFAVISVILNAIEYRKLKI